jgi:hypothetical protein
VSPFHQEIEDEEALRRLFTLGMIAWNAALLPESEQQNMVQKTLGKALRRESWQVKAMCEELVNQMIERKIKYFRRYERPIVDFVLTDNGPEGFHLSVLSTLP